MAGKDYRDLDVWREAMDFVVDCHRVSRAFPKGEAYGLTSQLQRAAVSVPANIAEGQGRQHDKEFLQHLSIAYGSLAEAETHVQIACRLEYLDSRVESSMLAKAARIGRMLNGLRKSLETKIASH
jgi:four helix bundle protein